MVLDWLDNLVSFFFEIHIEMATVPVLNSVKEEKHFWLQYTNFSCQMRQTQDLHYIYPPEVIFDLSTCDD